MPEKMAVWFIMMNQVEWFPIFSADQWEQAGFTESIAK
jgi:hypothetical protein